MYVYIYIYIYVCVCVCVCVCACVSFRKDVVTFKIMGKGKGGILIRSLFG